MSLSGSCLCGAVRYVIDGEPKFASKCYCKDCQKETGTGHITAIAVPDAAVHFTGEIKQFSKQGDSGQLVVRGFCPTCGTTLFGRPQMFSGLTLIRAGTLDDASSIKPSVAVFGSRAPHWDQPPANMQVFPELPPPRG
jgi:hypothetical protein